jgi:hypothetical protein
MADTPISPNTEAKPRRRSPRATTVASEPAVTARSPAPKGARPRATGGAAAAAVAPAADAPLRLNQTSVGQLTADRVEILQGAVAHAQVNELTLRQGAAALVAARSSVHLGQSAALVVVAREAEIGAGSAALLVVAREVRGDVKPIVDWRGALALGAGFGAVVTLLGALRRHR